MSRHQPQVPGKSTNPTPLQDSAQVSGIIDEFDVPDLDGLWQERTQDFGSIRLIALRRLSPQNEKYAAVASKGEGMILAFELSRRAIAYVVNEQGTRYDSKENDGSSEAIWHQLGSKLRTLAMKAYATLSVPDEDAQVAFIKSRRTRA